MHLVFPVRYVIPGFQVFSNPQIWSFKIAESLSLIISKAKLASIKSNGTIKDFQDLAIETLAAMKTMQLVISVPGSLPYRVAQEGLLMGSYAI